MLPPKHANKELGHENNLRAPLDKEKRERTVDTRTVAVVISERMNVPKI